MTSPVTAGPSMGRSPFAGLDLCRAIGITVAPGAAGPNFDQDLWDFNPVTDLAAYMAASHKRWNLAAIRNPLWRIVAKEYLVALMVPAHESVRELPSAFRVARTVAACVNKHYELIRWLNWLTDNGVTELGQVTDHLCESYITDRRTGHDKDGSIIEKRGAVNGAAQVVAGLAQYRDLFTTDRYPGGFRPFGGRAAVAVAGLKTPGENSTPPVPAEILQPMLAAALYVVDTLGPQVVSLTHRIKTERERVNRLPEPRSPGWGVLLQACPADVGTEREAEFVAEQVTEPAGRDTDCRSQVSEVDRVVKHGRQHSDRLPQRWVQRHLVRRVRIGELGQDLVKHSDRGVVDRDAVVEQRLRRHNPRGDGVNGQPGAPHTCGQCLAEQPVGVDPCQQPRRAAGHLVFRAGRNDRRAGLPFGAGLVAQPHRLVGCEHELHSGVSVPMGDADVAGVDQPAGPESYCSLPHRQLP